MLFGMASKASIPASCLPLHPTSLLLPFMLLGTSGCFCPLHGPSLPLFLLFSPSFSLPGLDVTDSFLQKSSPPGSLPEPSLWFPAWDSLF